MNESPLVRKEQDRFLFLHFINESDEIEPERISLRSGLVKDAIVYLEIGEDPVTRTTRVFRREPPVIAT